MLAMVSMAPALAIRCAVPATHFFTQAFSVSRKGIWAGRVTPMTLATMSRQISMKWSNVVQSGHVQRSQFLRLTSWQSALRLSATRGSRNPLQMAYWHVFRLKCCRSSSAGWTTYLCGTAVRCAGGGIRSWNRNSMKSTGPSLPSTAGLSSRHTTGSSAGGPSMPGWWKVPHASAACTRCGTSAHRDHLLPRNSVETARGGQYASNMNSSSSIRTHQRALGPYHWTPSVVIGRQPSWGPMTVPTKEDTFSSFSKFLVGE